VNRILSGVAAAALSVHALTGCSATANGSDGGDLTVSAAASLTEAFTELADEFEAGHSGTSVKLNFGGSSSLAEQVVSGAPVDVLATASRATMDTVRDEGYSEDAPSFATNSMTIAVPPDNPAAISSLADLARDGVRVAQCAAQVPCGVAAATTLANAGLSVTPVTLDPDVKTVLGRVASGEVDAGLVYVTDIKAAAVDAVAIPSDVAATTEYAITVIDRTDQQTLAREFVKFVLSEAGQKVLRDHGFGAP
jgi:molybdate transport system substrate-binding protein